MTNFSKTAKALALAAVMVGGAGPLFSVFTPTTPSLTGPAGKVAASLAALPGSNLNTSFGTTTSSTVIESSLMSIKTTKIMGLVSAVTAEAAESMGSGAGTNSATVTTSVADSGKGMNVAASSGSNNRSSVWLRASFGAIDNATNNQKWNGQSYLTMVGADYKFNKMFCAGLALSYNHLNGRTEFNNGTTKQDTLGVNPYLIIVPHKNFNLELVGGWSMTNAKDQRNWQSTLPTGTDAAVQADQLAAAQAAAAAAGVYDFGGAGGALRDTGGPVNAAAQAASNASGNAAAGLIGAGANGAAGNGAFSGANGKQLSGIYKASPKSQAMFGGVFANFVNKMNKTSFSLQVGYLWMQSKMKKYNETSLNSGQIYTSNAAQQKANTYKAGTVTGKVLVGYQMTPSVMPFLQLHTQYDVQQNKGVVYANGNKYTIGRSAFGGGTGFHVRNDDAFSGSLQFDYTKRGQLTTYVTGLRLHYGF